MRLRGLQIISMILTTTKNLRRRLLGLMREYDDGMVHSENTMFGILIFPSGESFMVYCARTHTFLYMI
jgi:hypothetical protein